MAKGEQHSCQSITAKSNEHVPPFPLPSNRHHRSSGDCLEGKRENYQVCSVQYCMQIVHSAMHTHMNRPNRSLDWVFSHWAHFTVLRFIFVYVGKCMYFLYDWLLHECVVIVTW